MPPWWTDADQAEFDLLIHELVELEFTHREHCEACLPGDCPVVVAWREHVEGCPACRGDAPLTYGLPCPRKADFIAHSCHRCEPCQSKREAIEAVVEWRERRSARSFAIAIRALQNQIDETTLAPKRAANREEAA